MKNSYITGVLAALLLLCGCSKDDSPFAGKDAHVVSFVLVIDGVEYVASVSNKEITVNVPTTVDLKGATVSYALCENATILPDPAQIDNWNEEQVFRVQAYNSDYVSYRYVVNRTDIVQGDNVQLTTQHDVDEFAKGNINRVSGNLIIGTPSLPAEDPITDLSGLSSLTEVGLNLVVNNGFSGTSLAGLSNLHRVGGLRIGNDTYAAAPQKQLTIELPVLQLVGNIVLNSDSIVAVSMPKLETVANLYLNSIRLKTLNLQALSQCVGDMTVKAITGTSYTEDKSNQVMTTFTLPALKTVSGSLWIENFWKVTSFALPVLENVAGNLTINYIRTLKTMSLPTLTAVGGTMTIQANDEMTRFSAPSVQSTGALKVASYNSYSINLKKVELPVLTAVHGNLTVQYAGVTSLEFPKLEQVDGTLLMDNMQFVTSIALPLLTHCEAVTLSSDPQLAQFDVSQVDQLTMLSISSCQSLGLFKSPQTISGNVTLNGGNKNCTFTQLQGLESVGGKLTLSSYKNSELDLGYIKQMGSFTQSSCSLLETMTLSELETVGDFTLSGMSVVSTLAAPKLKEAGNMSIKGLLALNTVTVPLLSSVKGNFTFYGGSYASQASQSLTERMDGFASLSSVTGQVDIRYCGNLTDFTGLRNIISSLSGAANWNVQNCGYNPTYQNMVDGKYTAE